MSENKKGDKMKEQRYGKLVLLKEIEPKFENGKGKKKRRRFLCQCDCGNQKEVVLKYMQSGNTKSCGCLVKEKVGNRISKLNTIHGLGKHPLYNIWRGMKMRCYNVNRKAYKNYGGRGIIVYNKWLNNFKAFYDFAITNGWKEGLTIDKIDNDGNYVPSNCQFITRSENASKSNK